MYQCIPDANKEWLKTIFESKDGLFSMSSLAWGGFPNVKRRRKWEQMILMRNRLREMRCLGARIRKATK
jgi:hypothetical protein